MFIKTIPEINMYHRYYVFLRDNSILKYFKCLRKLRVDKKTEIKTIDCDVSFMQKLIVENCCLKSIPFIPNLICLIAPINDLRRIPYLPELKILKISNNFVKYIPFMPKLTQIEINLNFIRSIKFYKLDELFCSNNRIKQIKGICSKFLYCTHNKIKDHSYTVKENTDNKYLILVRKMVLNHF